MFPGPGVKNFEEDRWAVAHILVAKTNEYERNLVMGGFYINISTHLTISNLPTTL